MRFHGFRRSGALYLLATLLATATLFSACEDDQGPQPMPSSLTIVSGDGQYSKHGTELETPLVVRVTLTDGQPGAGEPVTFTVIEGDGALSARTVNANGGGIAQTRWTLGPGNGEQRVRASVGSSPPVTRIFTATSSDYYCPEEDPTFVRTFSPAGDVFLFTRQSSLFNTTGPQVGLAKLSPLLPGSFDASGFTSFDEDILLNVVRDCAFSASGDFYIAWTTGTGIQEIRRIVSGSASEHFSFVESFFGTEITAIPGGVLGGCDEFGPFTVGCRDTLTRYDDAIYGGTAPDAANNDAVAADPVTGDLYFIALENRRLMRLPLDGYEQAGPLEEVAILEIDEAYGAVGMVVHNLDRSVYIMVQSTNTRGIVKVTLDGMKTTASDFFVDRGAGNAAGIQSDLAINQTLNLLYSLDTLNNVIVVFQPSTGVVGELAPTGDPFDASDGGSDERVGLAVLP
jgi:hypothetical protein